jgi:hypothetical protein
MEIASFPANPRKTPLAATGFATQNLPAGALETGLLDVPAADHHRPVSPSPVDF